MKVFVFLYISLSLLACSQAGVLNEPDLNSSSSIQSSSQKISGHIGISPINKANIDLIDVSKENNPVVIGSTVSDEKGYFEIDAKLDQNGIYFLTSSRGITVNPINNSSILLTDQSLSQVFSANDLAKNKNYIQINAFTSLFANLFNCLSYVSESTNDPYIFSKATFSELFGIDPIADYSGLLTQSSDNEGLLSLFNLAFSQMSVGHDITNPYNIITVFNEQLAFECSLSFENLEDYERPSLNGYEFNAESFRRDLIGSIESLRSNTKYSDLFNESEFRKLSQNLNEQHFLFNFRSYDEI